MRKSQLVSLWVVVMLWVLTLAIWYSLDPDFWGLAEFVQATVFWGIFASLSYVTLRKDRSE